MALLNSFAKREADFILSNPPFNVSDWDGGRLRQDQRWKYGVPPVGDAIVAWVQHMKFRNGDQR